MSQTHSLSDKTILVTGAARRIGAAMVRAFHERGARLVLHFRNSRAQAEALASELNQLRQGSVVALQADLLDGAQLAQLASRTLEAFGHLDVLINNASSFYPTPLGSISAENWNDLVGSNLMAPMFLSQALAPALSRRDGLILNMVDIHARRPMRQHTVYCVAKAGLAMLTLSLAKELGPGVRVNAIAPGAILWPDAEMPTSTRDKILSEIVLGRAGSPDDIVSAAMYFMVQAPYVTGQTLAIDGGRSLGW